MCLYNTSFPLQSVIVAVGIGEPNPLCAFSSPSFHFPFFSFLNIFPEQFSPQALDRVEKCREERETDWQRQRGRERKRERLKTTRPSPWRAAWCKAWTKTKGSWTQRALSHGVLGSWESIGQGRDLTWRVSPLRAGRKYTWEEGGTGWKPERAGQGDPAHPAWGVWTWGPGVNGVPTGGRHDLACPSPSGVLRAHTWQWATAWMQNHSLQRTSPSIWGGPVRGGGPENGSQHAWI